MSESLEDRVNQLDADVLSLSKAFTDLLGMYLSMLSRIDALEGYADNNNETLPPLLESIHALCTQNREDINGIVANWGFEIMPAIKRIQGQRTEKDWMKSSDKI